MSKLPKIAIIGGGPTGIACALECERLGVIPDLFESGETVGWEWPSVILLLNVLEVTSGHDVREYLIKHYKIDIRPIEICREIILKSPNKEARITGDLGYFYARGKKRNDVATQLLYLLENTPLHYNHIADYKELSQKYDYVIVGTGNEQTSRDLGVWEDYGQVNIWSALVLGNFKTDSTTIYFNTEYAGKGYARLTPLSSSHAIVDLYTIGKDKFDTPKLFEKFFQQEGLSHLEIKYQMLLPSFSMGRVKQFQVENVLLAGRSAGLTERLTGTGCVADIISGVLAARAVIKNKDYETLVKPLLDHVENVSSLRKLYERLDNEGLDKMVAATNTPGVGQLLYNNNKINLLDLVGTVLKRIL